MPPIAPFPLLILAGIILLVGILGPLALWRRPRWGHRLGGGAAMTASALGLAASLAVLAGAPVVRAELFALAPFGVFSIRLDALAAVFLGITSALTFVVSLFGLGYARHFEGRKHVGLLQALLNAFVLATALVPLADQALGFLLVWELMAVSSFLLVAFEHEQEQTRQAAVFYALMTQVGAGCLYAAFMLLGSQCQSWSFDGIRAAAPGLPATVQGAVFLLALVGFGAKAGLLPLHGWLPEAHPAAPSHVSALMSGAMIKTGVYGIIRLTFDFFDGGAGWWGLALLALGSLTAVMGALYAVTEGDLKRLLAYSSIENVGILMMGIGAAALFAHHAHPALAALALVAALYHAINHACFKGLLFLGAGAVQAATHTVVLDRLGGLITRMPLTAGFFLVGVLALTAMPFTNGFVSEWLTYQALFSGLTVQSPLIQLALPLAGGALALTGGLAMAAGVKAFAVGFLAKGRSAEAAEAVEAPRTMLGAMGLLALACLGLGLAPNLVVPALNRVVAPLVKSPLPAGDTWLLIPVSPGLASLSMPLLVAAFAILLAMTVGVALALGGRTQTRVGPTWGCGLPLTARSQTTAMGYAQPLRTIFGRLLMPHAQEVHIDPTASPYFRHEIRYALFMEAVVDRFLYAPVTRWVLAASRQMTRIQGGSIHLYLAYMFAALIAALVGMKALG